MKKLGVSIKNQMIRSLVKMIKCAILARFIMSAKKHVKLINIQILKALNVKNIYMW